MKRLIFCMCGFFFLFSFPSFSITTTDDFEISAYKNVGTSESIWVKVQVQNLSSEMLGPGRDLGLGDGSGWLGTYADAFSFTVTGTSMQRVALSFEFENFLATDASGDQITGDVRFNSSGFTSDYGTSGSGVYRYLTARISLTNYTYRETWPLEPGSGQSLNGGVLGVSGIIQRKRSSQGDSSYTNSGLTDARQQYTRTGVVQLLLDQASYDAALYEASFSSTVRVSCLVD